MEMRPILLGSYHQMRVSLPWFRIQLSQETGMLLLNRIHVPDPQGAAAHRQGADA